MTKNWTNKHINNIPGSPSLYEIQKKNAFCGTAPEEICWHSDFSEKIIRVKTGLKRFTKRKKR